MVTTNTLSHSDDNVHVEQQTKFFLGENYRGEGTLYVAESAILWKDDENSFQLQYPKISLHAISRDLSSFPHECIYCLLESSDAIESEEKDPEPDVTEIRFVPSNTANIQAIYDAITACQELHPDPDDIENIDDEEDGEEIAVDEGFYTAADDIENMELSAEGQEILARLQQNMRISSQGDESNNLNGQFDDADIEQ